MKNVAFLWHFHQPPYFVSDEESILPFVFLHSIRDYIDFPYILSDYENVHMNFNFTPVLLEQIINLREDPFFKIAKKEVSSLTEEEKYFILKNFFSCSWENAIKPLPRFYELLIKRGFEITKEKLKEKVKQFTNQDYLDLIVLFYLSWCGEYLRSKEIVKTLIKKGSDYKEEEKIELINFLKDSLKDLINFYKEIMEKKQIEITTSPYFHPILPILLSVEEILKDHPELSPYPYPSSPQEVIYHLEKAKEIYIKCFKKEPTGLWPSEGAVSNGILNYINAKVMFSDDTVFFKSKCENYDILAPYFHKNKPDTILFFRDSWISNRFGFAYGGMEEEKAINEFFSYVNQKARENGVLWIILDGENPWGGYQNFGRSFLRKIFERSEKEKIKFLTIEEALNLNLKKNKIDYLFSGSWVDASFYIWTSDPIKNKAWEMVHSVRDIVKTLKEEKSLYYFYASQASDWFWWFGKPNYSPYEPEFDFLFRFYLKKSVEEAGLHAPLYLEKPLIEEVEIIKTGPIFVINPQINGEEDSYYEWANAISFSIKTGDAMHLAESIFSQIHYGFNKENLFLRLDPEKKNIDLIKEGEITLFLNIPFEKTIKIFPPEEGIEFAFKKILEFKIPFKLLGLKENEEVAFFLKFKNKLTERIPRSGLLSFKVPHKNYEEEMWSV